MEGRTERPGEVLKEMLIKRGWSQTVLAEVIGKPLQLVNDIINGRRSITPETAMLLAAGTGVEAQKWMELEAAYQLAQLKGKNKSNEVSWRRRLYEQFPVSEMIRLGWIQYKNTVAELENELSEFFGRRVLRTASVAADFRLSRGSRAPKASSLIAWLRCAEIKANEMNAAEYSPKNIRDAIQELRMLSAKNEPFSCIAECLSKAGVRLVEVPHLRQTYVDGAAFWLDESRPAVVLSRRYNRVDNLFFTLFHELAHIKQPNANPSRPFVDVDLQTSEEGPAEIEANRQARDWLIDPSKYADFHARCRGRFSEEAICQFASDIGVHTGIVVGRLQFERHIAYNQMREFLVNVG